MRRRYQPAKLCLCLLLLGYQAILHAAPGDVLFSDDFESGSLAANWSVNNSGGGDAGVSSATASSGTQSMYTRWNVVSVTSNPINAAVPALSLSLWVRRGADAFSEDPEAADEDLILEYLDNLGNWILLENFPGGGPPGEIFTPTYVLPASARHSGLRLRLRQTGGDGGAPANGGIGWDYWHVDDVVVTETSPPTPGAGFCDDFESGLTNWTLSSSVRAGIGTQTSNSPTHSLYTRHGSVTVTSRPVDMTGSSGLVTAWIRRGADAFSEDPDNNEDLELSYLNNSGNWIVLETFNGNGTPGEIFNRSYALPADALHGAFQFRLRQTGGSGDDFDYWHVDDVCLQPGGSLPSSLVAYYAMDESAWNGTAGEVVDSGGTNNATAIGLNTTPPSTASTLPAIAGNPGTCGYGEFAFNNNVNVRSAVDTGIDMNTIGNQGSITFWYKSNEQWNGNRGDRMLLDASTTANGQKYFFVMLRNNSRIRFALEDTNDGDFILDTGNNNFSANAWVHLAVTWDLPNDRLQIYVNGNLAANNTFNTNGTLGNLDSLYIGDNRSTYLASGASANSANGSIDELRIYSNVLSQGQVDADRLATHPCGGGLHHIELEHDGSGLTCEPESITLRACANTDCSSLYTSSVDVTLSPTGWVGGNTQTITGGTALLALRQTTASSISLDVSASTPTASNTRQCLNTASGLNDCNLTFYDSGFLYSIPNQTACTTSAAITVSAVRLDNTTQACVPTFAGQTRNLDFSLNYINPNTGTRSLTLNYNGTDYSPINNTSSQSVPVNFDSNGQATFTVNYPDAGQISLNSRYTGSLAGGDAGLIMSGSATYVSKPAKLYVYADEANAACSGSVPGCSAFKRAGEAFNLNVRAACADNSVTPNFQLNGISVTHTNTAPAIAQGNLGVSSFNFSATDNGQHTLSQTVSEVGAYTFNANAPLYFGETIGNTALNTSAEIGRFYPDHFCLTASTLQNRVDANTAAACTDNFNYLDEDLRLAFSLSAQAMGRVCSNPEITQNYTGAWSRFSTPFVESTSLPDENGKWNFAAANDPAGSITDLSNRLRINTTASTPATGQFSNGQITINAQLSLQRAGTAPGYSAETPWTDVHIGIRPRDDDDVQIDSTDLQISAAGYRELGISSFYFGRLFAENAFGSNQPDIGLDMYATTQYCNAVSVGSCTDWQQKTDDSCSLYTISTPTDTALGRTAANDGLGYYQRASASVSSSVFDFDDPGTAPDYARVHVPDSNNHSAGWRLFYTGTGDGGDFLIPFRFPFNADPAVHPYLLHSNGVATFGQFRGDDRIIYWREILQ